jgi:ABC-type branched-subunit amino acid transport system substrate-binding protein
VTNSKSPLERPFSRRTLLRQAAATGAGVGVFSLGGAASLGLGTAWATEQPPMGTWPAGSSGNSVTVGASVPRTGTYAVQGEDELKGYQLAVEHINQGHDLIKKISPKTKKGVLGKEVKLVVADSGAKPNDAVQAQQRFITENKVVLMTGSTSSAVAVALNKLAQREKVLYVAGISGSNDTTGKDCVRYGFRQNFSARPQPRRSARSWSRSSARTRRRPISRPTTPTDTPSPNRCRISWRPPDGAP